VRIAFVAQNAHGGTFTAQFLVPHLYRKGKRSPQNDKIIFLIKTKIFYIL